MSGANGDGVHWRTVARAAVVAACFLALTLAAWYVDGDQAHEAAQDQQITSHEKRLGTADIERTLLRGDLDGVARGVQWLVNRRVEELGAENLADPPPIVDPASARGAGGRGG